MVFNFRVDKLTLSLSLRRAAAVLDLLYLQLHKLHFLLPLLLQLSKLLVAAPVSLFNGNQVHNSATQTTWCFNKVKLEMWMILGMSKTLFLLVTPSLLLDSQKVFNSTSDWNRLASVVLSIQILITLESPLQHSQHYSQLQVAIQSLWIGVLALMSPHLLLKDLLVSFQVQTKAGLKFTTHNKAIFWTSKDQQLLAELETLT